ncbi:uncharacterized protein LOC128736871 [Sabethes cyaneus]|uniref:uncharacterized protein LOC128736871 n=1 Tax=Sabethes cyaneus TaxID=53552 RepID=UPI00237DB913|nr:uncharacterized protein LOC128736871 [Sabethes cyaneus]
MKERLFQKCCRLCLDDKKQQLEIRSVERLDEALLDLYDLKISSKDRCSQNICVECYEDVSESQKWLEQLEKQKRLILANQARFREELLDQLGPEQAILSGASQANPVDSTPPVSGTRVTRRSARKSPKNDSPKPKPVSIKKEPIVTRNSKRKLDWEPPQSEQESETTTEATSNEVDEEEEIGSETTTTTSADTDMKCHKCEAHFEDLASMQNHTCEYICSICSKLFSSKWNLRRHLVDVHKICRTQWMSYWNPKAYGKNAQSLLVETSRPKKRYRYESDSPTDIEDSSNDQAPRTDVEIICNYCGVKFDSQQELKDHDCEIRCNICGMTFAKRNYVKNHKIRVHHIDPTDPSLSASKSRPVSRAASRPPSRAATVSADAENHSDDEPLSTLANKADETFNEMEKTPGKQKYRYFCTVCDYSNMKRYRLTAHLIEKHNFAKESIDADAIPKEAVRDGSKTPDRSKTPQPRYSGAKTPLGLRTPTGARTPFEAKSAEQQNNSSVPKTPDLLTTLSDSNVHRARSKSTYMDYDIDKKRKRSYSSCSNKLSRSVRSTSNPPPSDRRTVIAKRRVSTAERQQKIHPKFKPLLLGIDMNRLHLTIHMGCETYPPHQQIRMRASSHYSQDPSSTKRLFRLKSPVGAERQGVLQLRNIFNRMSQRVSGESKVAGTISDTPEQNPTLAPLVLSCPEGEVYEVRDVDTQDVTTVYQSGSEIVHVAGGTAQVDQDTSSHSKKKKKKNKKEKRRKTDDDADQQRSGSQSGETDLLAVQIKSEKIDTNVQEEMGAETDPVESAGSNVSPKQSGASSEQNIQRNIHDTPDVASSEIQEQENQAMEEPETIPLEEQEKEDENVMQKGTETENDPTEAMEISDDAIVSVSAEGSQNRDITHVASAADTDDNVGQTDLPAQDTEATNEDAVASENVDGTQHTSGEVSPDSTSEKQDGMVGSTPSPMEVDEPVEGSDSADDDGSRNNDADVEEGESNSLITSD